MEKNLIKYDLKKMFNILIIFYILSIILGGIARIFAIFDNITFFNILKIIFASLNYAVWGNIIVHTFVQIIMRFNKNFYGDESYLTHTLPVTKIQLLISKYISSLIVVLSSILVLLLSVFIMFYSKENMTNLKALLDASVSGFNISATTFVILIAITLFTQICAIISMSFAGVVIGKRFNIKKNIKSLIFIFAFYISSIILTLIFAILMAMCMGNVGMLFSNEISSSLLIGLLILAIVCYVLYAIIFFFITKWQFEKGVNVD